MQALCNIFLLHYLANWYIAEMIADFRRTNAPSLKMRFAEAHV